MGQAKRRGTYEQRKAEAIKSRKLSFKDNRKIVKKYFNFGIFDRILQSSFFCVSNNKEAPWIKIG